MLDTLPPELAWRVLLFLEIGDASRTMRAYRALCGHRRRYVKRYVPTVTQLRTIALFATKHKMDNVLEWANQWDHKHWMTDSLRRKMISNIVYTHPCAPLFQMMIDVNRGPKLKIPTPKGVHMKTAVGCVCGQGDVGVLRLILRPDVKVDPGDDDWYDTADEAKGKFRWDHVRLAMTNGHDDMARFIMTQLPAVTRSRIRTLPNSFLITKDDNCAKKRRVRFNNSPVVIE